MNYIIIFYKIIYILISITIIYILVNNLFLNKKENFIQNLSYTIDNNNQLLIKWIDFTVSPTAGPVTNTARAQTSSPVTTSPPAPTSSPVPTSSPAPTSTPAPSSTSTPKKSKANKQPIFKRDPDGLK